LSHHTVIGAWIQAVGTVINAIDPPFSEDDGKVIAKVGNILQAIGSSIISDYTSEELVKLANEVQTIGNLFVVTGLYVENINLEIQGNFIQAMGAGIGLIPAIEENDVFGFQGDFLQSIGNGIQGISGIKEEVENVDVSLLDDTGAWIQAAGSVISAINMTIQNQKDQHSDQPLYHFIPI